MRWRLCSGTSAARSVRTHTISGEKLAASAIAASAVPSADRRDDQRDHRRDVRARTPCAPRPACASTRRPSAPTRAGSAPRRSTRAPCSASGTARRSAASPPGRPAAVRLASRNGSAPNSIVTGTLATSRNSVSERARSWRPSQRHASRSTSEKRAGMRALAWSYTAPARAVTSAAPAASAKPSATTASGASNASTSQPPSGSAHAGRHQVDDAHARRHVGRARLQQRHGARLGDDVAERDARLHHDDRRGEQREREREAVGRQRDDRGEQREARGAQRLRAGERDAPADRVRELAAVQRHREAHAGLDQHHEPGEVDAVRRRSRRATAAAPPTASSSP